MIEGTYFDLLFTRDWGQIRSHNARQSCWEEQD